MAVSTASYGYREKRIRANLTSRKSRAINWVIIGIVLINCYPVAFYLQSYCKFILDEKILIFF